MVWFRQTALFEVNVGEIWVDPFLEETWLREGTYFALGKWGLSLVHQLHKHLRWLPIYIALNTLKNAILLIFRDKFAKSLVRSLKFCSSLLNLHLLERLAEMLSLVGHLEGQLILWLLNELILHILRLVLRLRLVELLVDKGLPLRLLEFLPYCFKYVLCYHTLYRFSFLFNFFFSWQK